MIKKELGNAGKFLFFMMFLGLMVGVFSTVIVMVLLAKSALTIILVAEILIQGIGIIVQLILAICTLFLMKHPEYV